VVGISESAFIGKGLSLDNFEENTVSNFCSLFTKDLYIIATVGPTMNYKEDILSKTFLR